MHSITLEKDGQTQVLDTEKDAERISTLKAQGWKEKAQVGTPVSQATLRGAEEKIKS